MITNEVYQVALGIVNAYHEQVRLEALEIKEIIENKAIQKFRNLKEVEPGDKVKCTYVHAASIKNLTFEKEYEVLNTDSYRFLIKGDSGTKKWYHKDNGHFKLF